jgi:hypothetical protein
VLGLSNFLTLQTLRVRQNHLFRTNHLCIRPVSFARPPLIELCLPALSAGTKFVAQGAAPFAGPEAFSFCHCVRPIGDLNQLSVLNSALTKIASATLVESAFPFLLDLKVFGISTYKNFFEGHSVMNQNRRSENVMGGARGSGVGLNVAPGSLARHPFSASRRRDDCALPGVRIGVV